MKKVEDLTTEDFVSSAETCRDISIDQARVTKLKHDPESAQYTITFNVGSRSPSQLVSVSVGPEHPFFVTGKEHIKLDNVWHYFILTVRYSQSKAYSGDEKEP